MTGTEGVVARSSAHLRALWAADRPAFGVWSVLPDPTVAELVAASSFDYVCVDLQHGIATWSELPGMLRAMRGAGLAPIVRVPWNEPATVMRALDTGASAVLVPMVNSGDEAARAAAACRFPPTGERSWGPMWGDTRPDGALPPAEQDAAAICLVMVETQAGVEALEEIVRAPGVDGVYIGPNDLALGCGYGRATYRDSTEMESLIQRVIDTCRGAGVVAGLHCSDPQMAVHWAGRGARLLTAGQDTSLLRAAAGRLWDAVARPTGRAVAGSEG
jgi:4-hydroxy-2-oxoheptanedioate aldolase